MSYLSFKIAHYLISNNYKNKLEYSLHFIILSCSERNNEFRQITFLYSRSSLFCLCRRI